MTQSKTLQTVQISDLSLWEKTREKRTLLYLSLELTARCNNDCSHCYVNLPAKETDAIQKELGLSEIKKIVDDAVSLGCLWVHITGGEPLLRSDFNDIYIYLKKKGLLVTLFTNASLISDEHIRLFEKYPPRNIEVSIYGITPKTHKKVTRNNLFSQTQNGIKKLIEGAIPVTLKATILRSNVKELDAIKAFCQDHTDIPFRFDPFLHLRVDGNKQRNKEIVAQRLTAEEIIELEKNDTTRFEALKNKCHDLFQNKTEDTAVHNLFKCGAGLNSCYISYDGTYKLCCALCHQQCTYNLRQGTLFEAWKIFTPAIRSKTSAKNSFNQLCMTCSISPFCLCCPAHADLETGELDGHVPYFCDMATKRVKAFKKS